MRRMLKTFALLALIALAGSAIVWRLTWIAPTWYRPHDPSDAQAVLLAEAVESRLVEEAHKVRGDEKPWTLRVRSEQVNAWLSLRLPRWLIHEQDLTWPDRIGLPQVRITEEGVNVAIQFTRGDSLRTIVLRLLPTIDEQELFLPLNRVSLGRVVMPGYTLDDLIEVASHYGADEAMAEPEVQWLLELLAGRESVQPLATLADDRRVRLLNIELGEDYMDLTMQTLAPEVKQ